MATIEIDNKKKTIRQCGCNWNQECNHVTKLFSSHGNNAIRGEALIMLDLSGDTEIKKNDVKLY